MKRVSDILTSRSRKNPPCILACPDCGEEESLVVDSRFSYKYSAVRRRRECTNCKSRWTTYELSECDVRLLIEEGFKRKYSGIKEINIGNGQKLLITGGNK